MGNYGKAAVKAVELVESGYVKSPIEAWQKATIEIFGEGTSQRKVCPRSTFLGLCEEGLIKGIPPDDYTKSKENKEYAIKAVQILREEPALSYDQISLWNRVIEDETKVYNQQMDVVTSLWNNDLIIKEKIEEIEKKEVVQPTVKAETLLMKKDSVARGMDKSAIDYYEKGYVYAEQGQYQNAIESFNKAVKINPKYADAWCGMGFAYKNLGDLSKALKCFQRAVKFDPKYEVAWYNMGHSYGELNDHFHEIECYEKSLQINPDLLNVRWQLEEALRDYPQYYEEKRRREKKMTVESSEPTEKESKALLIKRGYETAGQYVKVGIKVENTSITTITGVKVLLDPPSGLELVNPTSGVIDLGVIMPKGSQGANFQIRPIRCIDDVIHATIVYRDATGTSVTADMEALRVRNICPMLTDEGVDKEQILMSLRKGEIRKNTSSFKFRGDLKTAFIMAESRVRGLIQLDRDERFINAHYIASACYIGRTKYGKFDFATEFTVCGKENEGLLTIGVYAEEEAILSGFFYEILEDVRKSVEIIEERVNVVDETCPECGGKFDTSMGDTEGYLRCGLCETLLRLPAWERG